MRVIALNSGPLGKMASGDAAFDKTAFQTNAARLESVWAMNPGQCFVPGTDKPGARRQDRALHRREARDLGAAGQVQGRAERAGQQISALAQAARSGDEKAMRAAAGEVGKSCKACHDDFRAK
jgi:cytochrome c556